MLWYIYVGALGVGLLALANTIRDREIRDMLQR